MFRPRPLILATLAAMAAAPLPLSASPGGANSFRLPTPTATPTQGTSVQGPVDRSGPVPVAPRAIGTATPTPAPAITAAPTPAPQPTRTATPQPQPRITVQPQVRPQPRPTQVAPAPRQQGVPQPQQGQQRLPTFQPPLRAPLEPAGNAAPPLAPGPTPTATATASAPAPAATSDLPTSSSAPETAPISDEGGSVPWWWWALGGGVLALLGGAFWWRRRSVATAAPAPVVKPSLGKAAPSPDAAPPGTAPADTTPAETAPAPAALASDTGLKIEAQALSLGRSFANATLSYAITITNQSGEAIENIAIEADMTTAHGRVPVEQQVADASTALPPLATIDRLGAGSAKQARGEFRLPLSEVRMLRQGSAPLFVPLLRLKIHADGVAPVTRTFVVGLRQPGRSERLQPFRLDEMAQVYRNIGARELA